MVSESDGGRPAQGTGQGAGGTRNSGGQKLRLAAGERCMRAMQRRRALHRRPIAQRAAPESGLARRPPAPSATPNGGQKC